MIDKGMNWHQAEATPCIWPKFFIAEWVNSKVALFGRGNDNYPTLQEGQAVLGNVLVRVTVHP